MFIQKAIKNASKQERRQKSKINLVATAKLSNLLQFDELQILIFYQSSKKAIKNASKQTKKGARNQKRLTW